jgi:hypothetical protein
MGAISAPTEQAAPSRNSSSQDGPDFITAYTLDTSFPNERIEILLSEDGVVATQYSVRGGVAGRAPIRGVLIRYKEAEVYAIDYEAASYEEMSFDDAVLRRRTEFKFVNPDQTPAGRPRGLESQARRLMNRLGSGLIRGVQTRTFRLTVGDRVLRLSYAYGLPMPPENLRKGLSGMRDFVAKQCSEVGLDGTADVQLSNGSPADYSCELAGRPLLRAEIQVGNEWRIVADTARTGTERVPRTRFEIDQNLHRKVVRQVPSSPPTPHIRIAGAFPRATPRATETFPDLNVPSGTDLVMAHPEIYAFFWGKTFAVPSHVGVMSYLYESYGRLLDPSYVTPVQQYGVSQGKIATIQIDNSDPSPAVGDWLSPVLGNYIVDKGLSGQGPAFWYTFGAHDPLYTIIVPRELPDAEEVHRTKELNGSEPWGYHDFFPNMLETVAPFPFTLFVHEGMPFTYTTVQPLPLLVLPLEGMLLRDSCSNGSIRPGITGVSSDLCTSVNEMDSLTYTMSHEYIEAITDPIIFLGWSVLEDEGELADLCESRKPWGSTTRLGVTALATYWSNQSQACVPASEPTITIFEPHNGDKVPWATGGASIYLGAFAQDPLDDILTNIQWNVDGKGLLGFYTSGPHAVAPGIPPGPHTITASVTDSQALTATATISVNVTSLPPVATITSPLDGSTFASDDSVVLRGYGFDYQDGLLSDSLLNWSSNLGQIGTGGVVTGYQGGTIGDQIITLQVTNSLNVSAKASVKVHFTAAKGNPTVSITYPKDRSWFTATDTIQFLVVSYEPGGIAVPESWIRWTSDVDGVLRDGEAQFFDTLSGVGGPCGVTTHHVTVTITDPSNGAQVSDTVTVYIGADLLTRDLDAPFRICFTVAFGPRFQNRFATSAKE